MARFSFKKTLKPRRLFKLLLLAVLIAGPIFVFYIDTVVRDQFEGKRWALPARVYARPLELYVDLKLDPNQFEQELIGLGYRNTADGATPGSYYRRQQEFEVVSRPFTFWDGPQRSQSFHVGFSGQEVSALTDAAGAPLTMVRLDPLLIGSIYPAHNEDRVLVRLQDVPASLITTLIAVEDRKFYTHYGIDPRGILRALLMNVRGGHGMQGGSTLTQQLVKNFYLTQERTLRRKAMEVLMALLLERHYSKDQILEAYLNEIYLGQDGSRAIHGFGLASQFYFGHVPSELDLPQVALLVGLVKGPSYYDPRRHPERALARRNVVLTELKDLGIINDVQYLTARRAPLGVLARTAGGATPYPAFIDLVHRQLQRDYREEDLRSEGLQIFTTLDPRVQQVAEKSLATRLAALEKQRGLPTKSLEGAVVVTNTEGGEVLAVVGGRDARYEGFNRALDAQRQVGSLIKPAVYLAALEHPDRYTLVTTLDDGPLIWHERGSPDWSPHNYDRQFHGQVELRTALAHSYNIATVRLGAGVGLPSVIETAQRLGVDRPLNPFISTVLGAANLAPIEVAQMYETVASGGFRTPLRAIREVLTKDGAPLQRYDLAVRQVVDPGAAYLLTTALQGVVRDGTAAGLKQYISPELNAAGKTGTTDDLRDSWFAGYTGDKLGIVWIGRDDNRSSGLTGATGAMTVWGEMMSQLDLESLDPPEPDNIERVWIDPVTHLRADASCAGAVEVPFIRDSAPTELASCVPRSPVQAVKGWFRRLFGQ
jgi:penicillin-binding protein 1B